MAGCNPRKCSPKKLCFNCAQRVCDKRWNIGLPRYQAAHTGRWSGSRSNLDSAKRPISFALWGEIRKVLSDLPLLEVECRRVGLYKTALAIREAVKVSGFEADSLAVKILTATGLLKKRPVQLSRKPKKKAKK